MFTSLLIHRLYLCCFVALFLIGRALAATFTVTNAHESGAGSLRFAIQNANGVASGNNAIIEFDAAFFATPRTIQLQSDSAPLLLERSMEINGPPLIDGHPAVTINGDANGNNTADAGDKPAIDAWAVTSGTSYVFRRLGWALCYGGAEFGGALRFSASFVGSVLLEDCDLRGNRSYGGGAVSVSGGAHSFTMRRCVLTENRALNTSGGAVSCSNIGSVTIDACSFIANHAQGGNGALQSVATSTTIADSSFTGNSALASNGALLTIGNISLERCTFAGNQAGGGAGAVALNNMKPPSRPAEIINCTFTGNTSVGFGPALSITNGVANLRHCTVVENSFLGSATGSNGPGAIALFAESTASLTNCLVAGNLRGVAPDAHADFLVANSTLISAEGGNLIGTADWMPTVFVNPGDQFGTSAAPLPAGVGPLQNNGGLTLTRAPLKGSLAVNAGVTSLSVPVTTDQRGLIRPAGAAPDTGAVEFKQLTFNQWSALYFTGVGGEQFDDPDGDGLKNLTEFFTGTDPTTPSPNVTTAEMSGGKLRMTYPVADHVFASQWQPAFQTSQTLQSWNSAAPAPTVLGADGNTTRYEVLFTAGVPRRFARLMVVPAP